MQRVQVKGYLLACLSSVTYGLIPLFTLPMMAADMESGSILFYRYIFAVILLGILMKAKGEKFSVRRNDIPVLLLMGVMFAVSSLTLFDSYHYLAAGIASTILFLYPVFVAVIMALFFKEKVSVFTVLAITLAFWGILTLYAGDGNQTLHPGGVLLVIVSSLTYAFYIVGVNKSRIREMSSMKLTFYSLLIGAFFFFTKLRFGIDLQPIPQPALWINIGLLSILPTVVSLVAMAYAVHCIGSTPTAILGALEPVTAVTIGVIVFNDPFTARIALGIVMIVVAVSLIIVGSRLSKAIDPLLHRLMSVRPSHSHRKH